MKGKEVTLTHEFHDFIPDELKDGVLYISDKYAVAIHKCPCGCGYEVVTPTKPGGWNLIVGEETVSLSPSIATKLDCKSHYWITKNKVIWA